DYYCSAGDSSLSSVLF
nr:immunoglobulin light chain junction region [Macaca mulatta]MOX80202.1 immunoglobulin light chain junction region [Macaca mulatta]MOX80653.1 immunoglobulin light chain junction region [Macaca mulatta]MOX81581.1 immunoglobulin light chain junction region [Macaca mulatta]MOX82845.1 immunoglobulin light chain junction region [Macaca mulatta]